jgi:hypothetical protein
MALRHTIRDARGNTKTLRLTFRTAIRAFCYECTGFNYYEVEKCTAPLCPLYPFRNAKARKGQVKQSQKQIQARARHGFKRQESTIS